MSKKKLSFLQVYDYADLMFHVAVRSDSLDAGFEDVRVSLIHKSAELFVIGTWDVAELVSVEHDRYCVRIKLVVFLSYEMYLVTDFKLVHDHASLPIGEPRNVKMCEVEIL